jgi:hypothetical protein
MKNQFQPVLVVCAIIFLTFANARANWETYEGIYRMGFEDSSFWFCDDDKDWWLNFTQDADKQFTALYEELFSGSELEQETDELTKVPGAGGRMVRGIFFIRFEGWKHPAGEYGHLGTSKWQITARNIYDLRLVASDDEANCNP